MSFKQDQIDGDTALAVVALLVIGGTLAAIGGAAALAVLAVL